MGTTVGAAGAVVLAVDQGTSSTKAMLVDTTGDVVATSSTPVGQSHPQPGWVEQDPEEIWSSVVSSVSRLVDPEAADRIVGLALSVQRESVVVWDHETTEPVSPLLGWQDQRTLGRARELAPRAGMVLARTGLPLDPMFSALKAGWLLDELDPDRRLAASGRWRLGTLDGWLLARLGGAKGGANGEAVTEVGNASRTQLLGLESLAWDSELLDLFGIPVEALPRVVSSQGPFPVVRGLPPLPDGLPVRAVMGDSHAALFAQAGWRTGVVKATYGTGSSLMALGPRPDPLTGVCGTVAWQADGAGAALAAEANIRSSGRTLTWLADLLGEPLEVLLDEAARQGSDGTTLVPAFGGLGAPWWDAEATPVVAGFSLGTRRGHLARAALESVAHQVDDVVSAFGRAGIEVTQLNCDGGLTRSHALMQLQADLSGVPVRVSRTENLSALGVAHLAGVDAGLWSIEELQTRAKEREATDDLVFSPGASEADRVAARRRWATAVTRSRGSG